MSRMDDFENSHGCVRARVRLYDVFFFPFALAISGDVGEL